MVAMDSASSVPPHIHPPIAQVPIATGDTLIDVPGISVRSTFILRASSATAMILFLLRVCMFARCEWWTNPISIGDHRGHGAESGLLGGDKRQRGPVEFAVTTRDPRDQPVPDHGHGWHRTARVLGLCKCKAHIPEHQ